MASPLASYPSLLRYGSKIGGAYKSTGAISITPTNAITSDGSTNSILGSIRWTNTDYAVIVQSFGFQILTTTGFGTAAPTGLVAYKVTNYTANDTGGTDATASFGCPTVTGMPATRVQSVRVCYGATAAMTAGTRTLGNPVYATGAWCTTSPGSLQSGTIYQFKWDEDEPIILLANEGFEYQLPYGYTLPASKNLAVNLITSWVEVPREIIFERYGI